MHKNLLALFMSVAAVTGAWAATGNIDYTYAQGSLFPYGNGKNELIHVGMMINNPDAVGMKITGIKAYINNGDNITTTKLWVSSSLKLKEPEMDIASFDVTPKVVNIGQNTYKELTATLSTPYTVTSDPVYLGYSLTVEKVMSTADERPIILSRGVNPDGFWIYASKGGPLRFEDYSATTGGVAYIVAIMEGDLPNNSLAFTGNETIYAGDNQPSTAIFNASNIGLNPVSNFKYSYTIDDGEPKEGTVTLDSEINPSLVATVPVSIPLDAATGNGPHPLSITVTEVNGQPNDAVNPTYETVINVIPFVPEHRPLIEEYTGLWCGWCTGGYIAMELIQEKFGSKQVSVCYHSNDPMAVTEDFPVDVGEFPNATIDRGTILDPYMGTQNNAGTFGIQYDIEKAMAEFCVADIDVSATIEGDIVTATSNVTFILDVEDAPYEVGYILEASGLSNPNWLQHNYYYNRGGSYTGTPLEILTTWPEDVPGLIYNDVAVDVSGFLGVEGSLPSTLKTNEVYTDVFTFNIAGNKVIQDREKLSVAAFVLDKQTGRVVNSNKFYFTPPTSGVGAVTPAENDGPVYNLQGIRVLEDASGFSTLPRGIYIVGGKKVMR